MLSSTSPSRQTFTNRPTLPTVTIQTLLDTPSMQQRLQIRTNVRDRATTVHCSSDEHFVTRLKKDVCRQMLKHVDIEPTHEPYSRADLPHEAQIKKAERFALDGWSSTKFHATGIVVAFFLAVMMIMNSPMATTPHM